VGAARSVEEFEAQRPRLFGLAYRMLGSAQEAEDVVQDAFIRWNGAERAAIVTPGPWLAKVVTNLALNRLTATRTQREEYVGYWLPEPVLTEGSPIDGCGAHWSNGFSPLPRRAICAGWSRCWPRM
jgi:DNA-directed RNA polymerase specialized sigma24 family protein